MSDAAAGLIESATFCKVGDEKRPGLVGLPDFTSIQVCDDDLSKPAEEVTNAAPQGWYVRVMFDELLNPDTVEDLIEVKDDQGNPTGTFTGTITAKNPVTLQCDSATGGGKVTIPYDGYYSPSGNNVTWPLGPSIVIKPSDPTLIATDSECVIKINDTVKDKDGNSVPSDQLGPFNFKIAQVQVVLIDPPDMADVDAIQIYYDNIYAMFNTTVDPNSFCADDDGDGLCDSSATTAFRFHGPPTGKAGICTDFATTCEVDADCPTGETCEIGYAYSLAPYGFTPLEFGFGPSNPLETDKDYTFEFTGTVKDQCGKTSTLTPSVGDQTQIHFHTNKFDFLSLSPGNGDVASPLKKPTMSWNNVIDITSLDATEWSITPAPTLVPTSTTLLTQTPGKFSDAIVRGHYQLATTYTLTLKAGAKVSDAYGVEWTNPADKTITWKTQDKILLSATSPKNGATVTKASDASTLKIQLSFNQSMDPTTLDAMDYTISPAVTFGPTTVSGCGNSSTSCTLILTSTTPVMPGDYTFTLKSDAQIKDFLGNVYTPGADKVIAFTVAPPAPPTPPATCF